VSANDIPTTIVLKRSSFGARTYKFGQEEAVFKVHSLSGNPYIEYRITIPALEKVHIRAQKLNDTRPNREVLRFDAVEIRPDRIQKDSYQAELEVQLQADNYQVLHRSNITVRVQG
jgi:hypothetical protein